MTPITAEPFGITKSGQEVTRYILTNENGMCVKILNYACIIQSILVPDRDGQIQDVVLGYDTLAGYEEGTLCAGAFVGRYANRIKDARFSLNGKTYTLEKNDGENHLHGVLARRVFDGSIEEDTVVLRYLSPAFEEGFPGNLQVEVRYRLTSDNALEMIYQATTDEDTVVNFTNHSYFNLNGQDGSDILSHELFLDADSFTESDSHTIPTGMILPVEMTPLDFRTMKKIGTDIDSGVEQLENCGGYDHNFIINHRNGGLELCAKASSEKTGIGLSCYTTEPGVQLYTGNYVHTDPVESGKGGVRYPRRGGFCLEAQHYPCSPNYPHFPSTVLHPGETYYQKTIYKFT